MSIDARIAASERAFLIAWEAAVLLAGPQFFGPATASSALVVSDKNDLRPNWHAIEQGFDKLSMSEQAFLAHILTFFNPDAPGWAVSKYLVKLKSPSLGALTASLDAAHREAVAALVISYRGW